MPEGLDHIGTVHEPAAHEPGCIDCLGKPNFGSPVNDPNLEFMGKRSDKFFRYLRNLAR